eukprot:g29050.t1
MISSWMVSYSSFKAKLDDRWGYILEANEAPIWLGEFGTNGYWTTAVWWMEVGEPWRMTWNLTITLLSGESVELTIEPDRSVNFLRRKAEQALQRPLKALFGGGRLNNPSRLCDVGVQDGDLLTAIVREPGPIMESYRKARAFAAICDGEVVTWGAPHFGGQLPARLRPRLVDVASVVVSAYACCALRNDGEVVTWGSELSGGDSEEVTHELRDVIEIYATDAAFAALKGNGSVVTWGDARNGGSSKEVSGDLFGVQKIFASTTAFAAIRSDGRVVTWGARNAGGDSSAVQDQLRDVKQIHATNVAFAAVRGDGSVVTWGAPSTGGDSSTVQGELLDVVQLAASETAFVAIREDGALFTWGDSKIPDVELSAVSRQVLATDSAFAALGVDGKVVTWGSKKGGDSSGVQEQLVEVQQLFASEGAFAALRCWGCK